MNYFELFGLLPGPTIDRTELTKKYFELQRKSHPDFHTNAGDEAKMESLSLSASINKGFGIFQNEDKTLEYFLQTTGSLSEGEKYDLPQDFLMEMMDFNEMMGADNGEIFLEKANSYLEKMFDEIKHILEKRPSETLDEEDLNKLKEYYYKKKYLKRILDRLAD